MVSSPPPRVPDSVMQTCFICEQRLRPHDDTPDMESKTLRATRHCNSNCVTGLRLPSAANQISLVPGRRCFYDDSCWWTCWCVCGRQNATDLWPQASDRVSFLSNCDWSWRLIEGLWQSAAKSWTRSLIWWIWWTLINQMYWSICSQCVPSVSRHIKPDQLTNRREAAESVWPLISSTNQTWSLMAAVPPVHRLRPSDDITALQHGVQVGSLSGCCVIAACLQNIVDEKEKVVLLRLLRTEADEFRDEML